jgi:integrase
MRIADRPKLYRGKFYVEWVDGGKRHRASLRTADPAEAERRLIDWKRDAAAPAGATVGEVLKAYLADKAGRVADHERLVNAWKAARPFFENLRPDQIDRDRCRAYTAERRRMGRKDGTILKELTTIRQALNWRGVKGAQFEVPSAPPSRDRHLTRAEYARLKEAAAQEPHVFLFVVLALATAARMTALLQLTWDRVDLDRGQIRLALPGETRMKGRATVPITAVAREALATARQIARTPYVIEYGDRRVGSVKKGFAAAARRAGLTDVTPHVIRHTAAVWMAEAGVPMDEIAQYLGHTNPKLTFRVYAKFSPDHLRRAAAALEA